MLLNQRLNAWVYTFHNIFVRRVPCRKGPPPLSFDESQHLLRTRHNIRRHSFCKVEIWKSRLDWRSIGRHWLSYGRDNTLKLVHRADSRMTACWNLIFSAWDRVQANIRQVPRVRGVVQKIIRPRKSIRLPWLYRLYYPVCISHRIDTWQIVYLSNKDPCPKI